jgi:hypothetical protein
VTLFTIKWSNEHWTHVVINTALRRSRPWRRALRAARRGAMKETAWHLYERRIGSSHE